MNRNTSECLFCGIACKETSADIIYETDEVIAFNDIDPKAPVHCLIIPKKHISTINDIGKSNSAVVGLLYEAAAIISKMLNIADYGYRVVMNCNSDAGQTVFHIHLHLLAGRELTWPPG